MRIGRILIQTPLGAWPGFGFGGPGDPWVKQNAVINIRLVRLVPSTLAKIWLLGSQITVKETCYTLKVSKF